jgi:uncharacterized membrane protein
MTRRRAAAGSTTADVIAIVAAVLLSSALVHWPIEPLAPVRIGLGLVSVLFAPGYVTLVAFAGRSGPKTEPSPSEGADPPDAEDSRLFRWMPSELARTEGLILSVLTSVAVVAVLGLLLGFGPIGVTPTSIVFAVNGYTLLLAGATIARRVLAPESAASLAFLDPRSWPGDVWDPLTGTDAVLDLFLLLLVVAGGVALVVPVPGQSASSFTEFYVLGNNESDEAAMGDYLSTLDPGETERIDVGIANREHRRINYTVVVQVQRTDVADRSVVVLDRQRISRHSVALDHDESVRLPYEFSANESATGCRVAFLLYRGDPPLSPTLENAYRELHLWHAEEPPAGGANCSNPAAIDARVNRSA